MPLKAKKKQKAANKIKNTSIRVKAAKGKLGSTMHQKKTPLPSGKEAAKPKKNAKQAKMNLLWEEILLKDPKVRKWLVQAVGENAIKVIREFETELSDEEISKRSGIRASDVRVVLNRLHSYGLATYLRKRDKNSGWYSYIWKLDDKHTQELVDGINEIIKEEETTAEEKEYYYCPQEKTLAKIAFENAVENNFRCVFCGAMLEFYDPKKAREIKKADGQQK